MSKVKIVPFHLNHLDVMDIRESERELIACKQEAIKAIAQQSAITTIIYNGVILAVMGAYMLWDGCYEVFVIPSSYAPMYPKAFCKQAKFYADTLLETGARRLQTSSVADATHDRWMTFLGFEKEGTMKQYSIDGQDFCLWARIKE